MRISVITAVRNGMPHLPVACRSLRGQTWEDIEHIVVDGMSDDGTAEFLAAYEPDVSVRKPDQGPYDALNHGLELATGSVVGLLHSDDMLAGPDVLRTVADLFAADAGLDILLSDVVYLDAVGRMRRRYRSDRFRPSRLAWGWMPAHTGMFVRSRVYEQVGGFAAGYRIAADYEWVVRAFTHHRLSYRHLPVVTMSMRLGGLSTRGVRSTATVTEEARRACRSNGVYTNRAMLISRYPLKLWDVVRT